MHPSGVWSQSRARVSTDLDGAPEAAAARLPRPVRSKNLLLLGVLVFVIRVLSAFMGTIIKGDTVSLVECKYYHQCLSLEVLLSWPESMHDQNCLDRTPVSQVLSVQ